MDDNTLNGPKKPSGERAILRLIEGGKITNRNKAVLDKINSKTNLEPLAKANKGLRKDENGVTPKQEEFARLVGGEQLALSEAYRKSYSTENQKPTTVWKNAYLLSQNPNIIKRIQWHSDKRKRNQDISTSHESLRLREFILNQLQDIALKSSDTNRLRALDLLGKVDFVGLYKERVESTSISLPESPEEITTRIKELLGKAS